MSELSILVNHWVLPAAVPYLTIAGYDFWLHKTDRQVLRFERQLHAAIIVGVSGFLAAATLGWNLIATVALAILVVAALIDELRFHAELDLHEKRLHTLGGLALTLCIGIWLWTI